MDSDTALVWFRKNLRVHDNAALTDAASADRLLGVYAFDPREFGDATYGGDRSFTYRKTGSHRARFLTEAVADLRATLAEAGSELVVRGGPPEAVVPALVERVDADAVYFQSYPTTEERDVAAAVRAALPGDVSTHSHWGHTLYHPEDLPVPVTEIPDTFTPFRHRVEEDASVREPRETPEIPPPPPAVASGDVDPGDVPDVSALDPFLEPPPEDDRRALRFEGGESAGLDRLSGYVWERDCLREYKETRNGLVGADYSSKLSPWLNFGCLSPRRVNATVREYERERVSNESTYWLRFELLWRDFFQFQFAKHEGKHFTREGIRDRSDIDWRFDEVTFHRWAAGNTGIPFVDAGMRELNATGYLSNRARQNVASFLANDLRIDWRRGAAFFETRLVDYDPASNYGNWAYVAGVGNDSRDQSFDVLAQADRYDPDAEYVGRWIPGLGDLPADLAHRPWRMDDDQQSEYGVVVGEDYPEPIVELDG